MFRDFQFIILSHQVHRITMKKSTYLFILSVILVTIQLIPDFSFGQLGYGIPNDRNIYISVESGNDQNIGSKEAPLKTLLESAKRVNSANGQGAINIILAEGIYNLDATVTFQPANWWFTKDARLTIRAEHLPDDSSWDPGKMPVVISTMPFSEEKNDSGKITGAQNFGLLLQLSHVTIQGLRILGEPVHENPAKGILVRNYPIVWEGKNLEDLRVTQCLFIGNRYAIPNHLGILANGKNLEVDHCLFYGVKDAVVMWNSPSTNSSMHHNLIIDSYGGTVWTWSATADFRFYNNIVSNANVLWVLEKEEKLSYSIDNSIIVGYNSLVNKGGGAQDFGEKANPSRIKINSNVILRKQGKLEIIEDQTSKMYLHIKPGTLGSGIGAGLFIK